MDNNRHFLPVSFRIFGFGEETREIINDLRKLNYDCFSMTVVDDEIPMPNDLDKMAIIIVGDGSPKAIEVAKTFHDADVLTPVIILPDVVFNSRECDSITTATPAQTFEIVKAIIDAIVKPCTINYDFTDLKTQLGGPGFFKVFSADSRGEKRIQEVCDKIAKHTSVLKGVERISILLFFNYQSTRPIKMEELTALLEYLKTFPENVECIWAVYNDDSIDDDAVLLTLIAAGKDMD